MPATTDHQAFPQPLVKWIFNLPPYNAEKGVNPENYPKGEAVRIDLKTTIQDIVVSPIAPQWYDDCVRAIVDRFAPTLRVVASQMR
jgi:hypothetical protein